MSFVNSSHWIGLWEMQALADDDCEEVMACRGGCEYYCADQYFWCDAGIGQDIGYYYTRCVDGFGGCNIPGKGFCDL